MYIILFEIIFFFLNSAGLFFLMTPASMVESEACQILILILDAGNMIFITEKFAMRHIKEKVITLSLREISEIT